MSTSTSNSVFSDLFLTTANDLQNISSSEDIAMLHNTCVLQKSPIDARDWIYHDVVSSSGLLTTATLPSVFDMRSLLPPVRDQGNVGACAAFAGAVIKDYQERLDINMTDYMSPWFIYTNRENAPGSGMNLRDVMNILNKKGICKETSFPYLSPGKPTSNANAEAMNFEITSYATVKSIEDVKLALTLHGPVLIAFNVYNFGPTFWKKSSDSEKNIGGHAVAIVGYDDSLKGFCIRNSWSKNWNKTGYTWFPYSDFGVQWEIWSCVDGRSGPTPAPTPTPPTPTPVPPIPTPVPPIPTPVPPIPTNIDTLTGSTNMIPFSSFKGSCVLNANKEVLLTDRLSWGQMVLPVTYMETFGRIKVELDIYSDFVEQGYLYVSLGQEIVSENGGFNNGGARYCLPGNLKKCYPAVTSGFGNNFSCAPKINDWNRITVFIDVPKRIWYISMNGIIRTSFYSLRQPNTVTSINSLIYIAAIGGIYKLRDVRVSKKWDSFF